MLNHAMYPSGCTPQTATGFPLPSRSANNGVSLHALRVPVCTFQCPGWFCGFSYHRDGSPIIVVMTESTHPSRFTSQAKFANVLL